MTTIRYPFIAAALLALAGCAIDQRPPPPGYSSWHHYWQHMSGHGASNR